jgi:hypothetical protein
MEGGVCGFGGSRQVKTDSLQGGIRARTSSSLSLLIPGSLRVHVGEGQDRGRLA